MKHTFAILSIVGMTTLCTTAAMAQSTSQQSVVGDSNNPAYPVLVRGGNGVTYACKRELSTTASGKPARECVRDDAAIAPLFAGGAGLAAAGPAVGVLLVIGALSGGGSSSATTTTGSGN